MSDPFTEEEHERSNVILIKIAESFDSAKVDTPGYLALIKLLAIRSAMIGYTKEEFNYILDYTMAHYLDFKEHLEEKDSIDGKSC